MTTIRTDVLAYKYVHNYICILSGYNSRPIYLLRVFIIISWEIVLLELSIFLLQLKVYALKRRIIVEEGLDTEISDRQGYASFYNKTDYFVIGYDTNYKENMFLLIIGLIALSTFITIATPLLLNAQYSTLHRLANEDHTNALFLIWATVIICSIATVAVITVDVYYLFIERLSGSEKVPAEWLYYLAIVLSFAFIFFDLILASLVKKQKDFPLPYMLQILFCQSCCQGTIVIQTLASWSAIVFMQLIAFHLTFIFLAFVASPVRTVSTLLLFVTGILSGISITTLFLAAFQKRNIPIVTLKEKSRLARTYLLKSLYLILFICILVFTIFFATCFIRVTIYVGDVQSGGIPALFASLAPSALLGGMGYLGKQVLEKYVPRGKVKTEEENDEDTSPHTSTGDVAVANENDYPVEITPPENKQEEERV